MYHNVKEEVFDGILKAALDEYIYESDKSFPSDEELAKMYPVQKKGVRKYKKYAKAKKYNMPIPVIYLRRIAAVFLVVISLSFGLLSTNANVRAAIADTVVTWYEKYIQINFSKDTNESNVIDATVESLKIEYVPNGFALSSTTEESDSREYIYTKENGDYMIIGIYSSDTTDITADIEQMEYEIITINEIDAYVSYNEEEQSGIIAMGNDKYTIWISACLEKSEIIKVAENIK